MLFNDCFFPHIFIYRNYSYFDILCVNGRK